MLYQELPAIDAAPLDRWGRWLVPVLIAAAGLTASLLLLLAGQLVIAGMIALDDLLAQIGEVVVEDKTDDRERDTGGRGD